MQEILMHLELALAQNSLAKVYWTVQILLWITTTGGILLDKWQLVAVGLKVVETNLQT